MKAEDWSFLKFFRRKKQKGIAVVWGCGEVKPIVNVPPDALRVKVKLRQNRVGIAFVKFSDRVEEWFLQPVGPGMSGDWKLGLLRAVNKRV